jgi:hypothetical protein
MLVGSSPHASPQIFAINRNTVHQKMALSHNLDINLRESFHPYQPWDKKKDAFYDGQE